MIKCNIENNERVVKFSRFPIMKKGAYVPMIRSVRLGILLKKYLDRSDCRPIFSNPKSKIDLRNLLLVKCKSVPEVVSISMRNSCLSRGTLFSFSKKIT